MDLSHVRSETQLVGRRACRPRCQQRQRPETHRRLDLTAAAQHVSGECNRDEMVLALGSRIGRYEITDMLGAGGMGEVYRARDVRWSGRLRSKYSPSTWRMTATRSSGSNAKPRPLPRCLIRTSWLSTTSDPIGASLTRSQSCSRGRRSASDSGAGRSPGPKRSALPARSLKDWRQPTRKGSSIVI